MSMSNVQRLAAGLRGQTRIRQYNQTEQCLQSEDYQAKSIQKNKSLHAAHTFLIRVYRRKPAAKFLTLDFGYWALDLKKHDLETAQECLCHRTLQHPDNEVSDDWRYIETSK
jgi:hypothetical protein